MQAVIDLRNWLCVLTEDRLLVAVKPRRSVGVKWRRGAWVKVTLVLQLLGIRRADCIIFAVVCNAEVESAWP